MAPGLISPPPAINHLVSKGSNSPKAPSRRVSGMQEHGLGNFRSVSRQASASRLSIKKFSGAGTSNISNVVFSLQRGCSHELGHGAATKLLNTTYDSIIDWIGAQRMSHLPAEGSSYDKVLAWTQLFVERLHSFDTAIEEFAGDSYLAAQLAYGYCAILLDVCLHVSCLTSGNLADA